MNRGIGYIVALLNYFTDKKGLLDILILDGFEGGKISNKTDTGRSPAPVGLFKKLGQKKLKIAQKVLSR